MAEAPKKTRKASGPRTSKPFYAIISYVDESGNPVKLDQERLTIRTTKDPAELVKLFTGGYDGSQIVVTVEAPKEDRPNPAQTPAAVAA